MSSDRGRVHIDRNGSVHISSGVLQRSSPAASRSDATASQTTPRSPSAAPMTAAAKLQYLFRYYCALGTPGSEAALTTMGSFNFIKCCRECPGIMVDTAQLESVFEHVKGPTRRRIGFEQWLEALATLAGDAFPAHEPRLALTLFLARHILQHTLVAKIPTFAPQRTMPSPTAGGASGTGVDEAAEAAAAAAAAAAALEEQQAQQEALAEQRGARLAAKAPPLPRPGTTIRFHSAGGREPALRLGIFVDFCCEQSRALFLRLVDDVLPSMGEAERARVELTIYPWIMPWTLLSAAVHQFAVAARRLAPDDFEALCRTLFEVAPSQFTGGRAYDLSPRAVHLELAALVAADAAVNADVDALVALLEAGECRDEVQLCATFALQNGIRASPTVTVNGIVDPSVGSEWSVGEWVEYINALL